MRSLASYTRATLRVSCRGRGHNSTSTRGSARSSTQGSAQNLPPSSSKGTPGQWRIFLRKDLAIAPTRYCNSFK